MHDLIYSNLMWTFITLHRHQLSDFKTQLTREDEGGDRMYIADRLLQQVSFDLFLKEAIDFALCHCLEVHSKILGLLKTKLLPTV